MENNHSHNHTHSHEHNHGHEHTHTHSGGTDTPDSKEELLALLSYMVSHNKHHAAELEELSKNTTGEAFDLLQKAIASYTEGNRLLEEALSKM